MIENERDCESFVTQLAAAISAIEGVGALVLKNCTTLCFYKESDAESTGIDSPARCVAIRGRVRIGDSKH